MKWVLEEHNNLPLVFWKGGMQEALSKRTHDLTLRPTPQVRAPLGISISWLRG